MSLKANTLAPGKKAELQTSVGSSCNPLKISPLAYRLAQGIVWSLLGTAVSRGLGLISSIVAARWLGQHGFGELGIIQSTVEMFGVLAGFGMGVTATKHLAEFRHTDPAKAGRILALTRNVAIVSGGLLTLTLLWLSPWLADKTLAAPHLSRLLQISSALLFLSAVNGTQTGALAGFEAFKAITAVNLWAGLVSFPLKVGGVCLAGLEGAVWGLVASQGIHWLLNHLAVKKTANLKGVPLRRRGCQQEWQVLRDFSLPAMLAGAMIGPVNWVCNAMLVNQPQGYTQLGIFNAANQWWMFLLFLPGVCRQVALPILSERLGIQDRASSGRILALSIKLNAAVVLPLVLVGCIFSPFIMQLYGKGFRAGWPTLVFVLLSAGLLAIHIPVGQAIVALGRIWFIFFMDLGWGLTFIGLSITLVPWGAAGLAGARFGAYALYVTFYLLISYALFKDKVFPTGDFATEGT